MRGTAALFLALFFLAGCGRSREFRQGQKMERLGRYPTAISSYEACARKSPKSEEAAEALFRMGEIYRGVLKDWPAARLYYGRVRDLHPKSAWAEAAKESLMNSPDYFPLREGMKRVYGDSESGGGHMRSESALSKEKGNRFRERLQIFAGRTPVSTLEKIFEKKEDELRRYEPGRPGYLVLLRYPPRKGQRWESLDGGERVTFTVEEDDKTVEVKAGIFVSCLKVRAQNARSPESWKVEYYAPEVGPILVGAATEKSETRIAELLNVGEAPERKAKAAERSFWAKVFGGNSGR